MPAGIVGSDRKLIIGAAIVLVALAAGGALLGPGGSDDDSQIPSAYSVNSGGTRAAFLLLRESGYNVRIWEQPPAEIESKPRSTLLVIAEPTEVPSHADRDALKAFVTNGGRVLFCGILAKLYFADAATPAMTRDTLPGTGWKPFHALIPAVFSRAAETVAFRAQAVWKKHTPDMVWLYGDNDSAVAVDWSIGKGRVYWWAGATPLTNSGITREGNLNLFLNTVTAGSDRPSSILWDEYFHGQRPGLGTWVARTPLKWAGWQLGAIALAALFTFSRRSGPVVSPAPVSRLSPLEFTDTMGGLYRRAGAAAIPVEVSYRHLRVLLTRRLGLSQNVSEDALAHAAGQRLGLPVELLAADLRTAGTWCFDSGISERQALDLVKRLEGYRSLI